MMRMIVLFCLVSLAAVLPAQNAYDRTTPISEVAEDPVFGDYGRLIFPVEDWYMDGDVLGDLRLTWYSHINPDRTVEICNYLHDHAAVGETVFYDIYTETEKAADPAKRDTGLFFFRGGRVLHLPYAMLEEPLPMSERCRTASLTHLSFPGGVTMPLPSSTGPVPRLPARIWRGQSASSSPMPANWQCPQRCILSGAALPEPEWQPGLDHTVLRPSVEMSFRGLLQSSCSIQDSVNGRKMILRPSPVSETVTA